MVCPVLKPSLQGVSRVLKIHVEILIFYVAVAAGAHIFIDRRSASGRWTWAVAAQSNKLTPH